MLNIENVTWKIQDYSSDEHEQQELIDVINSLAARVAEERPELAECLIASANYAGGITNKN